MIKHEWKDIEGYEGLYQVSTFGEVRSYDRVVPARAGKTALRKGRILSQMTKPNGYKAISLTRNKNDKIQALVHRLVASAFLINEFNKPQVNHKDGDKSNNEVINLEWSDSSEQQVHAIQTGLRKFTSNQYVSNIPIKGEIE
ncbi:NUMOD4 domain-containing protein [Bacillus thuringiensis]|uniref:NUMOD4 domain-containing protein n=1 Tax=Bacillus thuringiensis TaxID=1428 RepID=UPI00345AC50C